MRSPTRNKLIFYRGRFPINHSTNFDSLNSLTTSFQDLQSPQQIISNNAADNLQKKSLNDCQHIVKINTSASTARNIFIFHLKDKNFQIFF